jgi:hypothetical protein
VPAKLEFVYSGLSEAEMQAQQE